MVHCDGGGVVMVHGDGGGVVIVYVMVEVW